jgi:hypothetical protein
MHLAVQERDGSHGGLIRGDVFVLRQVLAEDDRYSVGAAGKAATNDESVDARQQRLRQGHADSRQNVRGSVELRPPAGRRATRVWGWRDLQSHERNDPLGWPFDRKRQAIE